MGESPENVFNFGAPGIENIHQLKLLSKQKLEKSLNWSLKEPFALFTYHPTTLENRNLSDDLRKICSLLEMKELKVLFTYSNSDNGGDKINLELEKFCKKNKNKYKIVKSLGRQKYLSALKLCNLMIGNSSSGIIESGSFNKPVVNIGNRQKGRSHGKNVINCNIDELASSIDKAMEPTFRSEYCSQGNIYGGKDTSRKVVKVLESHKLNVTKFFFDIK